MGITNFKFSDIQKDTNQDKIFLFILSYEYSLNYNQLLTLYNFSPDIFWSFINILKPLLKLGDRKASQLKQSAVKVYFKLFGSDVELNEVENEYITYLSQYVNDSFSNGEECLHFTSLKNFPLNAKGLFLDSNTGKEFSELTINSFNELKKHLDDIDYIVLNGETYNKTSRLNYMLEKYYGDLTLKELRVKNVKEIISMLDAKAIDAHNKKLEEQRERKLEQRKSLVHRS